MRFKWLRPYKIKEAILIKGIYILKELNNAILNNIIIKNYLKRFYARPKVNVNFIILKNLYNKLLNKINVSLDF